MRERERERFIFLVMGHIQIAGQTGHKTNVNINHWYMYVRNYHCLLYAVILGDSYCSAFALLVLMLYNIYIYIYNFFGPLFKFVLVLLYASVEIVGVSRTRDFSSAFHGCKLYTDEIFHIS